MREAMSHAVENACTGTGKPLFKLTRDSAGIFYHTAKAATTAAHVFRAAVCRHGSKVDGTAAAYPVLRLRSRIWRCRPSSSSTKRALNPRLLQEGLGRSGVDAEVDMRLRLRHCPRHLHNEEGQVVAAVLSFGVVLPVVCCCFLPFLGLAVNSNDHFSVTYTMAGALPQWKKASKRKPFPYENGSAVQAVLLFCSLHDPQNYSMIEMPFFRQPADEVLCRCYGAANGQRAGCPEPDCGNGAIRENTSDSQINIFWGKESFRYESY